jgi:hypothetical protein
LALAPVLLLNFWLGSHHTVVRERNFFSKAALIFGGAYTVLPYAFTPCFLWIFWLALPFEKLRGNEVLTTTLSAVTAA